MFGHNGKNKKVMSLSWTQKYSLTHYNTEPYNLQSLLIRDATDINMLADTDKTVMIFMLTD